MANDEPHLAIHPIKGRILGERRVGLTPGSRLALRIPIDQIQRYLPLVGIALRLGDASVKVGVPEIRPLRPSARLRARLVTLKINGVAPAAPDYPERFLAGVRKQLVALGIAGAEVGLLMRERDSAAEGRRSADLDRGRFLRRTLRVKEREIVGYAVEVSRLEADESILLQERGLGGRRHLGCGVFVPARV